MPQEVKYFTKEGLRKLKEELNRLKTQERPSISMQIADARDKGDLSENAEYAAAKEAQGLLERKIAKLEEDLGNARIIDETKLDSSKVLILSRVKIRNAATGAVTSHQLVSANEADIKAGKISVDSPIGKGLLGKRKGDVVEIEVPNGKIKFEIIAITRN